MVRLQPPSVSALLLACALPCAAANAQIRPAPPWIVAQRGASLDVAENTLPAFRQALARGARWMECDVSPTADGELVVIRGPRTGPTCDRDLAVADSTLAELRELDAVHGFRERNGFDTPHCPPAKIPTLREVLELVAAEPAARLVIEPQDDSVDAVCALVEELELADRIAFHGEDPDRLSRAHELVPDAAIHWDRPADADLVKDGATARQRGFDVLVLRRNGASLERLAAVRGAGLECGVSALDDSPQLEELVARGAQWIYTDSLAEALAVRERRLAWDRLVLAQREALDLPALAVGLVERGRLTQCNVLGELGPGRGDGLTTQFRLASISKTYTALLLAVLTAEGTVALDDPVADHLPEDAELPDGLEDVTLGQLATHTSGFPRMGATRGKPTDPYVGQTTEVFLDAVADARALREPGERHEYSNLGIGLLGLALAHTTGTPYPELLRTRVLEPMGLRRSGSVDPTPGDTSVARGYQGGRPDREQTPWTMGCYAPAGGVAASLPDLCRYAALHLDAHHGRPLPEGVDAEALRSVQRERFVLKQGFAIGLCWMRTSLADGSVRVWHNGALGGFRTLLILEPDEDRAVAVLTNRGVTLGADPCEAVAAEVFRLLRAEAETGKDGR